MPPPATDPRERQKEALIDNGRSQGKHKDPFLFRKGVVETSVTAVLDKPMLAWEQFDNGMPYQCLISLISLII